jgi:glycosyltransferase involved in cell wall biosynthesis
MKILLVINVSLDPNAGASGVTLKLGEAYEKLGHDVYYYSNDNLPLRPSGKLASILFPYNVARHIRDLSEKIGLDVVHSSSNNAWIWGVLFCRLRLDQRPLLITQSHGLEHTMHEQILEEAKQGKLKLSWKYPLYNGSVLLWQVAKSFRVADCCFMLNQYDAGMVKGRMGVAAEKVMVFPNAIPDEFVGLPFEAFSPEADRLPGIAFVGSYVDRKGIQYGVPVLNNLMQRYPTLRASFLGTGCAVEPVLNDFNPAVRDRVTVVPSFDKSELPHLLKDSHILLFPSLSEGFPLAVPEAMACGLAPIVTDIPGPTEIVVNGVNGLVVPPRDQIQLEQAMVQLIDDRACLQRLRVAAYEAVQDYTWSKVAQRHLDLYNERLDRSRLSSLPAVSLST